MSAQNAIMRAKINNEIIDLMLKSTAENIMVDETTTLATKLTEIIEAISECDSKEVFDKVISDAINALIDNAPETYNSLKKIADYISSHEDVSFALQEAVNKKVDKEDGKALSTNDFTDDLLSILNAIDPSLVHIHENKENLDTIQSSDITRWNEKSKIYVQEEEPESFLNGNLFFQIVDNTVYEEVRNTQLFTYNAGTGTFSVPGSLPEGCPTTFDEISNALNNDKKRTAFLHESNSFGLILPNGDTFDMYMNVDTYYGYQDGDIGHHIDFISKGLINSLGVQQILDTPTVPGSNDEPNPFKNSFLYKKLNTNSDAYVNNLPDVLRSHIVNKKIMLGQRKYSQNYETSFVYGDIGPLWIPFQYEVYGENEYLSVSEYEKVYYKRYQVFEDYSFIKKYMNQSDSSDTYWWTASVPIDRNDVWSGAGPTAPGIFRIYASRYIKVGVVLAFRFV